MLIKSEKLKTIRQNLPRGYGKIISERLNVNLRYVYHVANGISDSPNVLKALVELAEENQKEKIELEQKIDSLSNTVN